jgi:hypothetical protein
VADWQLIETRQKSSVPHEPVTIERLERVLVAMAYIVTVHGAVFIPLFEQFEHELAAMKADQDAVGRAKKLLEDYRGARGLMVVA